MDFRKILDTLLTAAIIFLFSSVFLFKDSVNDLSKNIAVMNVKAEARDLHMDSEWKRRGKVVDNLIEVVQRHDKRLDKLEWKRENEQPRTR